LTRESAATEAGLSEHQRKTALRVVNVPKDERDELIESENPPTVTQLAELGLRLPRHRFRPHWRPALTFVRP
jgi:hypothetical protein